MNNNNLDEKTGLGGIYFPRLFFLTEEEVTSMKVPQLKSYLKEVDLPIKGKKMVLTTRLMEAVRVASFFSVEKNECTGLPNVFRGPVVTLSQEVPKNLLGISSVDAQLVKHRFVNLFMLKGMTKHKAQGEAKKWLRLQMYPTRSWRRNATSTEKSTIRSRQQYLRDFLFGATGAYKATRENMRLIECQTLMTVKQRKAHRVVSAYDFVDTDKFERYTKLKKSLTAIDGKVLKGREAAYSDNEKFGKEIQAEAQRLYEASPYYILGRKIERLHNHRDEAIKKTIEPSHYYIESQPWMYKAGHKVGPEELFSTCREWLNSPALLNTEIPSPFLMSDGHRSLFDTQTLHEFGTDERILNMAVFSTKVAQADKRRLEERSEFLSNLDNLLDSL